MILYLIRGLPGVGKSTLAKRLRDEGPVIEADSFFMTTDGYQFDLSRLGAAHDWCQRFVDCYLRFGRDDCIVANTFTQRRELAPYYTMAKAAGVAVVEITITGQWTDDELAARSVHDVPVEVITRMRNRWEP